MKAWLISIVAAVGTVVATTATNSCAFIWVDEPKMPKAMLER